MAEAGRIDVADAPERSRYEASVDGELAGFAAYRRAGERVVFTHTEVDDRYEGKGVGSRLVQGALDDADERGLRVVPLCPFVKGYIESHDGYAHLVDSEP